MMHKRYGDSIKEGEKVFTVYSESERNIDRIVKLIHELNPIAVK